MKMGAVRVLTGLLHDQDGSWSGAEYISSKEALLGEESSASRDRRQQKRNRIIFTIFNALLLTGAIVLYAVTWGKYSGRNYCLRASSAYCKFLVTMGS